MTVLRHRQPDLARTFRTPAMPVVPALGVVIHFGYSYERSEPAKTDPFVYRPIVRPSLAAPRLRTA
ncbi:hypothetical protein ACFVDQ_17080 [Streptomyces sp. NPDC057684]|uniref:hypothetical protein n=1 Tax=unclassified Streptomyces TaxID=2593676 RepID=UPI0036993AC4